MLALWLLIGLGMWLISGWMPISRTQEGRVLETAREMVGQPLHDWLIPRMNGSVRLRKPPLAYWPTAVSFSIFGVSDRAGRFPIVVVGWAMLAVVYSIGRNLFNRRVGLFAAGITASSYLTFRYAILAETDVYAAAFVASGVLALLHAQRDRHQRFWLHLLAVSMAGAILAKGPPAAYLVMLAVALAVGRRDPKPLLRFFTSGAILTLLVLALPWFVYVLRFSSDHSQLGADLTNSVEGGDHHETALSYISLMMRATLPWSAVWISAMVLVFGRIKPLVGQLWKNRALPRVDEVDGESRSLCFLAAWAIAVLLPLCFWGNKQAQYLLPMMPSVTIVIAWSLQAALRREPAARWILPAMMLTAAALSLTGVGLIAASVRLHSSARTEDIILAISISSLASAVLLTWRRVRFEWTFGGFSLLSAASLAVGVVWFPTLKGDIHLNVIRQLDHDFPGANLAFRNTDLPSLSYAMRRIIPAMSDSTLASKPDPNRVVLDQQKSNEHDPSPPPGHIEARVYDEGENWLHAFVQHDSPIAVASQPTTATSSR